jgi:serine/threonine-protein kinase
VEADAPAVMAEAATRLMWLLGGRLEKHDEGDLWGDHALAALEKTGGSPHRVLTHRAALLERRGEFAEAKAALREVLDLLPPAQTYDRGIAYMRFGDLLRREQNGDGAVEAYTTTVELWTEGLGASHPNVAIARAARASGLSRSARNEEAVVEYRAAIAALEKAFGKTHPSLSASLVNLGITLKNLGRFEEAEAVVRRSLALETATFGAEHRKVADRREALGRLLTRRGKGAEALAEHVFAGKVFTAVLEEDHPWLVLNLLNQGDALRQMQALGRAEDAYRGAYERAAAHLDADDSLRSDTAAFYGRALVESGKYARAVATLGPAHADLATREGYEDVLAVAGWALARAQVETGGNVADAVALAKSARAGLAGHPEEVAALDAWVDAHE